MLDAFVCGVVSFGDLRRMLLAFVDGGGRLDYTAARRTGCLGDVARKPRRNAAAMSWIRRLFVLFTSQGQWVRVVIAQASNARSV
jgi:hypothetical protein